MSDEAIRKLRKLDYEVIEKHYTQDELLTGVLNNYDAVIVRSATKLNGEVLATVEESKGIRFIGRAGVGVDNINIEEATKKKIVVCNTPQSSTQSVVELTIGHLISSTRHIAKGDRKLRNNIWAKKELRGTELSGKNLGLVGFGRIAQGVSKVASVLGMNIHCYDPFIDENIPKENSCTIHNNVDDLFRNCTHISIHCNLNKNTYHLVNEERINMMPEFGFDGSKCGRHIVNCARGGIIDEEAAFIALSNGNLMSLALDVYENEPLHDSKLLELENFHGSPHIGASTIEAQNRIGEEIVILLKDFFSDKRPHSALN
jgi:D-3-phosphoglycerate dehydrogenase